MITIGLWICFLWTWFLMSIVIKRVLVRLGYLNVVITNSEDDDNHRFIEYISFFPALLLVVSLYDFDLIVSFWKWFLNN